MPKYQTQIPASRVPLVDTNGLTTQEWFRYFSDLFTFTGIGTGAKTVGSFYDTGTQTAAANTPTAISMNSTSMAVSIALDPLNATKIVFQKTAPHNIAFSIQFANASTTTEDDVFVWLRVNGHDIANTSSYLTVPKKHAGVDGTAILALNIFYQFTAGDYAQLIWVTKTGGATIQTIPGSVSYPASPGVIVTVNQLN